MIDILRTMWSFEFMRLALIAALLVGIVAPLVGTFLVQRRLALIGDGMGHVALAGVAVGVVTRQQPILTALAGAVLAAVVVELIRSRGRTSGDVALAIIFYGGIAAGVVVISKAPKGAGAGLTAYLFGAIGSVTAEDLLIFAVLGVVVLATTTVLRQRLFAVANDEEYALAMGMPVLALNVTLAVLTATTVVLSMRIVGLLLISALMIVPNATAQLFARSFSATARLAMVFGVVSAAGGVTLSYLADTPSGGTIVLVAIGLFVLTAIGKSARERLRSTPHSPAEAHPHEHGPGCGHEAIEHDDHIDYLHDGHRHALHGAHYDEHADDGADRDHSAARTDDHVADGRRR